MKRNSVWVNVMSERGGYQIYDADELECPQCRHKMLAGFGAQPLAERHQPEYKLLVREARASGRYYEVWHTPREKEGCAARAERKKAELARCDAEISNCRQAGQDTSLAPSQRIGAMQGEVDWMVAKQIAEEE
jgi:hypothetical protein